MRSVLAPVSASTFRNENQDWYGVVEVALADDAVVWQFDSVPSRFDTAQLYQAGNVVKRTGFRPASVQRLADGRTLVADWSRGVFLDEDGDVRQTFTHELMNDVHEIQRTPEGCYVVASTGMDTLLVLDEDFEELWRWHMWEHVDPATRPGQYYPHRLWYRGPKDLALNPDDRYHLNYVTVLEGSVADRDAIFLCSALNFGIFTVDMATAAVTRAHTDLDECHNPFPLGETYVVPESGADRVVTVDWEGHRETLFEGGLDFVKDADPAGDAADWLVTDTKNDRVLLWDEGESSPSWEYHLGEDANPYEADVLDGSDSMA